MCSSLHHSAKDEIPKAVNLIFNVNDLEYATFIFWGILNMHVDVPRLSRLSNMNISMSVS